VTTKDKLVAGFCLLLGIACVVYYLLVELGAI
jgi:hypothetical protein